MLLGGLGYFLTDFVSPNNVITFSGIFSNLALDFGLLIHLCFLFFMLLRMKIQRFCVLLEVAMKNL